MKQIILLLSLFTILIFVSACNVSNETAELEPNKTDVSEAKETKAIIGKNLVLVELFTSEG